jgi:23S rRNA pseudouridine1911/1915/1917 synthase
LDGIRLDAFVRHCLPQLSRRSIDAAIAATAFTVNRRKGKKGDRLTAGDLVAFVGSEAWLAVTPIPEPGLQVPVIFEDGDLLVVDKPAGMDTQGFSGREHRALTNFLAARRPQLMTIGKNPWEAGIVHRLDRETSGLVIVAKSQKVYEYLRAQFHQRKILKRYWALVWGETKLEGAITLPLTHDSRNRKKMSPVFDRAKFPCKQKIWQASTRFRRLVTRQGLSFLEIALETGVTHQIRVHFAAVGHPIVGDSLYGRDQKELFGLKRHFLHAFRVEIRHPGDGRLLRIESRLPDDLQEVVTRLGIKY